MAEKTYGGWEIIDPLGSGGQSDVFLLRSPERVQQRKNCLKVIDKTLMASPVRTDQRDEQLGDLATAFGDYARPEVDSELGALKVFKSRGGSPLDPASQEFQRLRNEIDVLRKNYPGLPKLLASSESEFWFVTEYFREGNLEGQLSRYTGNAALALSAFRSLVTTVKRLHDLRMVHRDIKPQNIFVRSVEDLVLGDFGIVFLPSAAQRVTKTNELVGPWDFMAPWLDIDERVEDVPLCSDVYMLGKVLWCMVSGKMRLTQQFHRQAKFNLVQMFPGSPHMERINLILDQCVVAEERMCLPSATELLALVEKTIGDVSGDNRFLPNGQLRLLCVMCGKDAYRAVTVHQGYVKFDLFGAGGHSTNQVMLRLFVCDVCGHHALFSPGYPEEGAARGWKIPQRPQVPGGTGIR